MVAVACGLLALGVVAFLISPLLDQNRRLVGGKSELDDLLKRKDFFYAAIRELNIDYNMGKLSAEDHQQLQAEYMRQASTVLDQLERNSNGKQHVDTRIEQSVLEIRKKRVPSKVSVAPAADETAPERLAAEAAVSEATAEEGIKCVQCDTKNEAHGNFCIECGAPLKKLTCASCRADNNPGAKFCAHCGEKL